MTLLTSRVGNLQSGKTSLLSRLEIDEKSNVLCNLIRDVAYDFPKVHVSVCYIFNHGHAMCER